MRSLLLVLLTVASSAYAADQSTLVPRTEIQGPALRFDWPALQIGVGSYEEGPTGLTIIRFADKASLAVDVRGGAPGTLNTDVLRLGYGARLADAVVFTGGSSYGEEAMAAVQTGLKDEGIRSGDRGNIAFVAGAVIFDLSARLNDITPDKRLAQAALAATRPGVFPLGAQGAGRSAMQGGFFGCDAHSGQGAAFRQIGGVKIAAFVVVNAAGSITDRAGRLVRCHRGLGWQGVTQTSELLQHLPDSVRPGWQAEGPSQNTTVSLIVTNQQMSPAELQRFAIQVHSSMGRAIEPFSTAFDGDTLFAASTQEVEGSGLSGPVLGAIASEAMWDAVLASVPAEAPVGAPLADAPEHLADFAGMYDFGGPLAEGPRFVGVGLELSADGGVVRVAPTVDGPAARAGVEAGDALIAIDGQAVQGLSIAQALDRLRGADAAPVQLTLGRRGQDTPAVVTVVRGPVRLRPLLRVEVRGDELWVTAVGGRAIFEFRPGRATRLIPLSESEFVAPGRYGNRISFTRQDGRVTGAVLNAGPWAQPGARL